VEQATGSDPNHRAVPRALLRATARLGGPTLATIEGSRRIQSPFPYRFGWYAVPFRFATIPLVGVVGMG
jgi:hypothetical protein